MHSQDTAQAVHLLNQAAKTLTSTAARIEALELRSMGISHTREISSPVPAGEIDISDPPPEKERDPWCWIKVSGYEHRETLRDHGFRWSRRRRAFYKPNCDDPGDLRSLSGVEVSITY